MEDESRVIWACCSRCLSPLAVLSVPQFSLADLRHKKNVCLHREQVRDVKFSPHAGSAGYVLSTSFDRTLKVRRCACLTSPSPLCLGYSWHMLLLVVV